MNYRICFFITSLIKGGAENQMLKLAIHLNNRGYDVIILSIFKDNDFKNILNKHNIDYRLIPLSYGIGIIKLYKVLKFIKPKY